MGQKCLFGLIIAVVGMAWGQAQAGIEYTVQPLPVPNGYVIERTSGLNDHGDVAGEVLGGQKLSPYLYRNGAVTIDSGLNGAANGINNNGVGAGVLGSPSGGTANLFINNSAQSLNWGDPSRAQAINDNGAVAGTIGNKATISDALGIHTFGTSGAAWAINDQGTATGTSDGHAFAYNSAQGLTDLGLLPNAPTGATTTGLGINHAGDIVGFEQVDSQGDTVPFLYSSGHMAQLGAFGYTQGAAHGINNAGQIVGVLTNDGVTLQPFRYSNGSYTLLNDVIDPSAGVILRQAVAINNNGQILAYGTDTSGSGLFIYTVLTPVPEPAFTGAAFVTGMLLLLRPKYQIRRNARNGLWAR